MCPAGQFEAGKSAIKWFIVAGKAVKLPGGLAQHHRDEGSPEVAVPTLLMVQAIHLAIWRYQVWEQGKGRNY